MDRRRGDPGLPGHYEVPTPATAVGAGLADRLVSAGMRLTPSRERGGAS